MSGMQIGLIVVSVAAVLLFIGGGVFGYLWWSTDSELSDTRDDLTAEIETRDQTIATQDERIGTLEEDLAQTQSDLDDAQTALEGTESQVQLLEDQQDTIRQCIVLSAQVNDILEAGDEPPADLTNRLEETCDEANRILGF